MQHDPEWPLLSVVFRTRAKPEACESIPYKKVLDCGTSAGTTLSRR